MKYSRASQSGSALAVAMVTMFVAVGLAYSAVSIATVERHDIESQSQQFEARALSEAGVHRAMSFVRDALALDPFRPIDQVDQALATVGGVPAVIAQDEALTRNGRTFGTFTVIIAPVANGAARDLTITSTGYVPDATNPRAKATIESVVRVALTPGKVFDYSYFINNWGWFYGDTINSLGNARSNGQFDVANYAPGIFGTPRYDSIDLSNPAAPKLVGYLDDNNDHLMDGNDGGVFAGWDIVNVNRLRGNAAQAKNQHDFDDPIAMPNLNDLTMYEALAKDANASLMLGGGTNAMGVPLPPIPVSNAVLGDEPSEKKNVVLIGTAAKPILLHGPVVVRGDVIIKGVVSGQGSIYATGNIYIADNLTYLNPPTTLQPAGETQAATETWITANRSKDFLGLFAKEHVVIGNFKDSSWRNYVGGWMSNPMNASAEDSGTDGISATRKGRDGIASTEDDDVLEGDGVWTVERYTQEQADLGLVPTGKQVGDPIPGSGEDIDGDGAYDGTATLNEFDLHDALNNGKFAGNLPPGVSNFAQLSSIVMTDVQAALYTNHAAGMLTLAFGKDFKFFGSIVSRNESLVYGTNKMDMIYDRRLSGGSLFGGMLPRTVAPLRVLSWRRLDNDVQASIPAP